MRQPLLDVNHSRTMFGNSGLHTSNLSYLSRALLDQVSHNEPTAMNPNQFTSCLCLCLPVCLAYLRLWMVGHGSRIPSDSHCGKVGKPESVGLTGKGNVEHVLKIVNSSYLKIFELRTCLYMLCQCLGLGHKNALSWFDSCNLRCQGSIDHEKPSEIEPIVSPLKLMGLSRIAQWPGDAPCPWRWKQLALPGLVERGASQNGEKNHMVLLDTLNLSKPDLNIFTPYSSIFIHLHPI